MIILDTNVVSELMAGGDGIDGWLATVAGTEFHTTVITRAEIAYGIARRPKGRRRDELRARADGILAQMADRTIAFDALAADRYGELAAERESAGRPISIPDAQIASIAYVHRASVATRNVRDFENCGITVINPFDR